MVHASMGKGLLVVMSLGAAGCVYERGPLEPDAARAAEAHYTTPFQAAGTDFVAATERYRVRVTGEGVIYLYPPQGTSAASDSPFVRLSTAAIGRGDEVFAGGPAPRGVLAGGEVRFERGVAREVVRNTGHGVVQSWVFRERPEGAGPLRVRLAVGGGCGEATLEQAGRGVHVRDASCAGAKGEGAGAVIDDTSWVDARGTATPVVPTVDGEGVVLVVPADVVERSSYPARLE